MSDSIHKMASADYYERQARQDYYSTGSPYPGEFFGRGPVALGLTGPPTPEVCGRLARGLGPDGTKLSQFGGTDRHFEGLDVCSSVKKWVSAVYAAENDASRRRCIEGVVLEAKRKELQYLEDTALRTRRGKGGARVEQCGMCATIWLHTTNQDLGPQLHAHACLYNIGPRADGTWGTILGCERRHNQPHVKARSAIYAARKAAGRIFDEAVERGMAELYKLERCADGTLAVPVPGGLIAAFSTRRAQILSHLEKTGEHGAAAAAHAAIVTRGRKLHEPQEQLLVRWQDTARSYGFDPTSYRRERPTRVVEEAPEVRIEEAKPRRTEGELRERTGDGQGRNATGAQADRPNADEARASQATRREALDAGEDRELATAARIARILARSRRDASHRLTRANVFLSRKEAELVDGVRLSARERDALIAVTRSRGAVQFLDTAEGGKASATVLRAAHWGWRRQGYRVLMVSPSKSEAESLEKDTGIHAVSARGFFLGVSTNHGLLRGYDSMLRRSGRLLFGFRGWRGQGALNFLLAAAGRWLRLNRKTVVVVANAQRLRPEERLAILRHCCSRRTRAKVVFIGDRWTPEVGPTLLMGPRRSMFDGEQARNCGLTW